MFSVHGSDSAVKDALESHVFLEANTVHRAIYLTLGKRCVWGGGEA